MALTDTTWTYAEGEAKRKDFAVYWIMDKAKAADLSFTKADLEIIGKGIEDMPIALNPEVTETQDVLGNNNIDITSYAETMEVTPMRIGRNGMYAQAIDTLIEERATLDQLKQYYLCVKKYKTKTGGACRAWVQEGMVEITDFATELTGVQSSHTVHFTGERILGSLNLDTMAFTADSAATA